MKDTFSSYHPIINLFYLLLVLGLIMFLRQPVCLLLGLFTATIYGSYLCGKRVLRFSLTGLLPIAIMIILINPLVNHQGITILSYFPSGNPFTLESIIYGVVAAVTIAAAIQWFLCWNQIMTTEKLVYLFGRLLPAFSLVLSMSLRLIPRYGQQFKAVAEAQRQLGQGISQGSLIIRLKNAVRILSITLTWAMEHSVETAASMKGRGYGLPGRTAYSLYRWTKRDTGMLGIIVILGGIVLLGIWQGCFYWTCFPMIISAELNSYAMVAYVAYGLLLCLPMLLNGKEELKWKSFS